MNIVFKKQKLDYNINDKIVTSEDIEVEESYDSEEDLVEIHTDNIIRLSNKLYIPKGEEFIVNKENGIIRLSKNEDEEETDEETDAEGDDETDAEGPEDLVKRHPPHLMHQAGKTILDATIPTLNTPISPTTPMGRSTKSGGTVHLVPIEPRELKFYRGHEESNNPFAVLYHPMPPERVNPLWFAEMEHVAQKVDKRLLPDYHEHYNPKYAVDREIQDAAETTYGPTKVLRPEEVQRTNPILVAHNLSHLPNSLSSSENPLAVMYKVQPTIPSEHEDFAYPPEFDIPRKAFLIALRKALNISQPTKGDVKVNTSEILDNKEKYIQEANDIIGEHGISIPPEEQHEIFDHLFGKDPQQRLRRLIRFHIKPNLGTFNDSLGEKDFPEVKTALEELPIHDIQQKYEGLFGGDILDKDVKKARDELLGDYEKDSKMTGLDVIRQRYSLGEVGLRPNFDVEGNWRSKIKQDMLSKKALSFRNVDKLLDIHTIDHGDLNSLTHDVHEDSVIGHMKVYLDTHIVRMQNKLDSYMEDVDKALSRAKETKDKKDIKIFKDKYESFRELEKLLDGHKLLYLMLLTGFRPGYQGGEKNIGLSKLTNENLLPGKAAEDDPFEILAFSGKGAIPNRTLLRNSMSTLIRVKSRRHKFDVSGLNLNPIQKIEEQVSENHMKNPLFLKPQEKYFYHALYNFPQTGKKSSKPHWYEEHDSLIPLFEKLGLVPHDPTSPFSSKKKEADAGKEFITPYDIRRTIANLQASEIAWKMGLSHMKELENKVQKNPGKENEILGEEMRQFIHGEDKGKLPRQLIAELSSAMHNLAAKHLSHSTTASRENYLLPGMAETSLREALKLGKHYYHHPGERTEEQAKDDYLRLKDSI